MNLTIAAQRQRRRPEPSRCWRNVYIITKTARVRDEPNPIEPSIYRSLYVWPTCEIAEAKALSNRERWLDHAIYLGAEPE